MRVSRAAFYRLVERAVGSLPERFRAYLDNVVIAVRQEPDPEMLEELGVEELLGVYLGTPLTERRLDDPFLLPDQILLFRGPLLRMCADAAELKEQIRITVVHEVGHFFGLSEEEIVAVLGE
ncbi:MAG: metallopeptidase family protein [Candidatus Eremiobacterota bacterium]